MYSILIFENYVYNNNFKYYYAFCIVCDQKIRIFQI